MVVVMVLGRIFTCVAAAIAAAFAGCVGLLVAPVELSMVVAVVFGRILACAAVAGAAAFTGCVDILVAPVAAVAAAAIATTVATELFNGVFFLFSCTA